MRGTAARHVLLSTLLATAGVGAARDALADRKAERLDPAGVWTCILYDDPVRGEERLLLSVSTEGAIHLAVQRAGSLSLWRPVVSSSVDAGALTFLDERTLRRFEADLAQGVLAGSWSTASGAGGWWCQRRSDASSEPVDVRKVPAEFLVPPLVPHLMVSPAYPREAIREAREGRVIACFLVDAGGTVFEPELVEVSHEIFAEPTLRVLERSRYNAIEQTDTIRPGCRSYLFQLDAVY